MAKEKQTCPVCGHIMTWSEIFFELKDAQICSKCAETVRVMYPLRHEFGRVKRNIFGQVVAEDPDSSKKDLFYDSYENKGIIDIDPVHELTLEEFEKSMDEVDSYRENLRRELGGHESIMTVDYVRPLRPPKVLQVGIVKARKFKDSVCVCGYVKVGEFKKGDTVCLEHNGQTAEAEVLYIYIRREHIRVSRILPVLQRMQWRKCCTEILYQRACRYVLCWTKTQQTLRLATKYI